MARLLSMKSKWVKQVQGTPFFNDYRPDNIKEINRGLEEEEAEHRRQLQELRPDGARVQYQIIEAARKARTKAIGNGSFNRGTDEPITLWGGEGVYGCG